MPQPANKNWINFFFGLLVALIPFLGLPSSWKSILFIVVGFLIAFFSLATVGHLPVSAGPRSATESEQKYPPQ